MSAVEKYFRQLLKLFCFFGHPFIKKGPSLLFLKKQTTKALSLFFNLFDYRSYKAVHLQYMRLYYFRLCVLLQQYKAHLRA